MSLLILLFIVKRAMVIIIIQIKNTPITMQKNSLIQKKPCRNVLVHSNSPSFFFIDCLQLAVWTPSKIFFHPYENSLDAIDVLYLSGLQFTCIIMHGGFLRPLSKNGLLGFLKSLNLNLLYVYWLAYETYLKTLTPLRQIFIFTNIIHVG